MSGIKQFETFSINPSLKEISTIDIDTYLLKSSFGYKIGKSKNVEKRIKSNLTFAPDLELILTIKGDYENYLHNYFKDRRIDLEWFSLSEKEIASIPEIVKNTTPTINYERKDFIWLNINALPFIKNLNVPGLKVFCYILANLKPNKNQILIKEKECMQYCGYKGKSNYYKGLINLLENKIIYRMIGSESFYFINVNFIFNGDRSYL